MHNKTIAELVQELTNKNLSSGELTLHYLNRIEKIDPTLNAFITVTKKEALKAAEEADQRRAAGTATPLTGIPIAQKDIFCTEGVKTSCGSKMLDNFIAPYDATTVKKFKQAGLVMLGKTNMDEFAMGSSNENSYYGPTKNPWDLERIPGGSSGGSAAAVAARLTPAATGTDTGGSIRQPSAMCGITGIKPTYGRVSRYGMIAFASSLDQGGIMARTAEDCALLLNVMAGVDPRDSTSINIPVPNYVSTLNDSIRGLKIGLPKEFFSAEGLDPEIASSIEEASQLLQKLGAELHDIHLPHVNLSIPAYYVVAPAECSSNLSRFDGIRYGYRCENPKNLEDLYKRSRGEGFGTEVKRRIMIGTYVLSAGYYDAYYKKAQQIRQLINQDYQEAFKKVDLILSPTSPTTAFKIGEKISDPISMYLADIYTISANLAGLPGIAFPVAMKHNLPVGAQLVGNHFTESKLLNITHQLQQHSNWHHASPTIIEV